MKHLLIGLVALALTGSALAQKTTFNLSLAPDVALEGSSERIIGLTLSIWGENPQEALSIGFVNGSTADSSGISFGWLNYAEHYDGLQFGWANNTTGNMNGWQHGIGNHVGGDFYGLQTGVVNSVGSLKGLQIGLLNHAFKASAGAQIGLLNIIRENDMWFGGLPDRVAPAMLFVNWRF
jgi:hypothetical protein